MNRTIKQYTLGELRALKQRLEQHFARKGDAVTSQEHMLMQAINSEMQSRDDYTYGPEVNYGHPMSFQPRLRTASLGGRSIEDESIQNTSGYRSGYKTLADCYEPGPTEIWYFKPGLAARLLDALDDHQTELLPERNALEKTHIKVGTVDSDDQREVFGAMQSDRWSPNGEAKAMMKKLGLGHISMAPGDVIVFPERTVMVTKRGFYDLGQRDDVVENMNFHGIIEGSHTMTEEPSPMAFGVGDIVYYGSRKGTLKGFAGDRDKLVVELPNGSRDIFPVQGATLEKPKMLRRAVQWAVGEDAGMHTAGFGHKVPGTGQKNSDFHPTPTDFVGSNAHFEPGQILYQGSREGEFVRFADGLRKQMILVKQPNGDHAMFNIGKVSTTKPKFMARAKSFIKGESVEMNENFAIGATVYCGSRTGTVQGFAKDDRTKLLVKLPNGDKDVFPVDKTSSKKPSMLRKAAEWTLGEGFQRGQTVYCNGKSGKIVDYARGDATKSHLVVTLNNGQTDSFPVANTSATPPVRKVAEDFGSSDVGAAMNQMIKFIKDQCGGSFSPTPELIEQAAQDVGSWYADALGVDSQEAAEIMQHHFMLRYRSGGFKNVMDEDTVVASAGTAGVVNYRGAVVGEEEEVDEADIKLGVPKGAVFKPKMTDIHYFNTRGTADHELEKLGMKKDKFGRYYLPQYDRSGDNYRNNFDKLAQTFGYPRSISLKK
jgi:hypothetical protein